MSLYTKTMQPLPVLLSFALLSAAFNAAIGDEFAQKGREVFQKNQDAVITLQIVVKSKVSVGGVGQTNEARKEITGTVVDPSGLIVTSLSASDPGQVMQNLMDENKKFRLETELSDLKVLLEDGTELPSEVVHRDVDLDLAVIRTKTKPASPLPALNLAAAGKADLLDEVLTINRLGKALGRPHAAAVERISAIVREPRLFYVPMGGMTTTALGSPAFTLDGKPLGIFVVRTVRDRNVTPGMFATQPPSMTGIIVPAAEVLKVVKEALGQNEK